MPLNGFEDWDDCVSTMKEEGHDQESAERICGSMENNADDDVPRTREERMRVVEETIGSDLEELVPEQAEHLKRSIVRTRVPRESRRLLRLYLPEEGDELADRVLAELFPTRYERQEVKSMRPISEERAEELGFNERARQEILHYRLTGERLSENERHYVSDPSEAPEDANLQEGPQGGMYYETGGGGGDGGGLDAEHQKDMVEDAIGTVFDTIEPSTYGGLEEDRAAQLIAGDATPETDHEQDFLDDASAVLQEKFDPSMYGGKGEEDLPTQGGSEGASGGLSEKSDEKLAEVAMEEGRSEQAIGGGTKFVVPQDAVKEALLDAGVPEDEVTGAMFEMEDRDGWVNKRDSFHFHPEESDAADLPDTGGGAGLQDKETDALLDQLDELEEEHAATDDDEEMKDLLGEMDDIYRELDRRRDAGELEENSAAKDRVVDRMARQELLHYRLTGERLTPNDNGYTIPLTTETRDPSKKEDPTYPWAAEEETARGDAHYDDEWSAENEGDEDDEDDDYHEEYRTGTSGVLARNDGPQEGGECPDHPDGPCPEDCPNAETGDQMDVNRRVRQEVLHYQLTGNRLTEEADNLFSGNASARDELMEEAERLERALDRFLETEDEGPVLRILQDLKQEVQETKSDLDGGGPEPEPEPEPEV